MAQATADALARTGAEIVLTSRHEVTTEHRFFALDLTAEDLEQQLSDYLQSNNLSVDILVNVAAVGGATYENTDAEFFRSVFEINTLAAFRLSKFVADQLIQSQKPGSIVNVTTVHASIPNTDPSYSTTKAGVLAMTRSLALKLAPYNIRINSVAPGAIAGGMNSHLSDEQVAHINREIPMARFGQPQDMASAILFLVSDQANYITGQDLKIDGGLSLADSSYNR